MSILIKNVLVNGETADIRIRGTRIESVAPSLKQEEGDEVINGTNRAAVHGFVNGHTHAAMTLFRGFADDMKLKPWLEKKIWPAEAKLTEEDVYVGTRLACLEMIRTGTTLFNDMYWHLPGAFRAVESMGIRGVLSAVFIYSPDHHAGHVLQLGALDKLVDGDPASSVLHLSQRELIGNPTGVGFDDRLRITAGTCDE